MSHLDEAGLFAPDYVAQVTATNAMRAEIGLSVLGTTDGPDEDDITIMWRNPPSQPQLAYREY